MWNFLAIFIYFILFIYLFWRWYGFECSVVVINFRAEELLRRPRETINWSMGRRAVVYSSCGKKLHRRWPPGLSQVSLALLWPIYPFQYRGHCESKVFSQVDAQTGSSSVQCARHQLTASSIGFNFSFFTVWYTYKCSIHDAIILKIAVKLILLEKKIVLIKHA